ncbi:serine/threonine-protein phosphatase 7 long form homolog [Carex rostrata]
MGETQVSWAPYHELYTEGRMPEIVADDHEMWLYRGPLVCFWIVEHHYPDRVLRQFRYPTLIPADPNVLRSVIMSLHGITHGNHPNKDWSEHHSEHYNRAENMSAHLWQMPKVDGMQL